MRASANKESPREGGAGHQLDATTTCSYDQSFTGTRYKSRVLEIVLTTNPKILTVPSQKKANFSLIKMKVGFTNKACWQGGNNGLLNVGAEVTSNQSSHVSPHPIPPPPFSSQQCLVFKVQNNF